MPEENQKKVQCLYCHRSDYEVPLVSLNFRGRQVWICAQCLPILIHNPSRLAAKIPYGKDVTTGPLA